jgi:hypothetical protein
MAFPHSHMALTLHLWFDECTSRPWLANRLCPGLHSSRVPSAVGRVPQVTSDRPTQ